MKIWTLRKDEIPNFQSSTSELEIASYVDEAGSLKRPSEVLSELLDEKHPLYKDRGTNQVIRLQGYIMASLEKHGVNAKSFLIVLEALENSMSPYLVAAAAKALRGMEKPNAQAARFLVSAIENVHYKDDRVSFDTYAPRWPLQTSTTALNEIFTTLQKLAPVAESVIPKLESWLANASFNPHNRKLLETTISIIHSSEKLEDDCCDVDPSEGKSFLRISRKNLLSLELEDQEGEKLLYQDFFSDKPTILVFFYTRCTNHNKCSLTVSKLGNLQKMIKENGLEGKVNTAAVSYDPAFDTPGNMKKYGLQRHVEYDSNNKFFRLRDAEKMPMVLKYFSSSVNYIGNLVNKHQLELYILDGKGRPIKSFTRLRWDPDTVFSELKRNLVPKNKYLSAIKRFFTGGLSIILPILIAFFPKCPFCWAGYMTMFGISSVSSIPYSPWILPVLCVLMLVNLWLLWRRAVSRKYWFPFIISTLGAALLILFGPILRIDLFNLTLVGMVMVMIGALLNSFPIRKSMLVRI